MSDIKYGKRKKMKIPTQKRIKYIGGVKVLFTRTGFYITLLNFLMLTVTSYTVVVKDVIKIPFWFFFLIICIVLFCAMLFEWVILLPSEIAFSNKQAYEHNNPIRGDLEDIKREVDALKSILKGDKK